MFYRRKKEKRYNRGGEETEEGFVESLLREKLTEKKMSFCLFDFNVDSRKRKSWKQEIVVYRKGLKEEQNNAKFRSSYAKQLANSDTFSFLLHFLIHYFTRGK